jgi:rubrerythrin
MKLKELMRVLVNNEKDAIATYEKESELFKPLPKHGAEAGELFGRIAEERRDRIEELGRILKHSSGFRIRFVEPARSIEAALRTHLKEEAICVTNFMSLIKQLTNPEFKERLGVMLTQTRGHIKALQAFQAEIKAAQPK